MATLYLRRILVVISLAVPGLISGTLASQTDLKYQTPPAVMVKLVDAPPPPTLSLSPAHGTGPRMLLSSKVLHCPPSPISPNRNCASLACVSIPRQPRPAAPAISSRSSSSPPVARSRHQARRKRSPSPACLSKAARVFSAQWSPDGQHIALVNADAGPIPRPSRPGLSLWIIDVPTRSAARARHSPQCGSHQPITWLNNDSLAVLAIPLHPRSRARPL